MATLITIGTPHRGSPVADAIASRTDPLLGQIPTFIVQQLEANAGALPPPHFARYDAIVAAL